MTISSIVQVAVGTSNLYPIIFSEVECRLALAHNIYLYFSLSHRRFGCFLMQDVAFLEVINFVLSKLHQ